MSPWWLLSLIHGSKILRFDMTLCWTAESLNVVELGAVKLGNRSRVDRLPHAHASGAGLRHDLRA
jgi:hypothetical protein